MKFISHADFALTSDWISYLSKHLFVLNDSGSLNLDGNFRFFVRFFQFLSLYLTNNVIASYIYIGMVFIISFFSFYLFARKFLDIDNKKVCVLASLFFAFNPVFLGNVSKIGLTLAVSFLPAILVLIKKFFDTGRQLNLILVGIFLLFSLIHPFTFILNLLITLIYSFTQFIKTRKKIDLVKKSILALILIILIFSHILFLLIPLGINLTKGDLETTFGEATSSNYLPFANTRNLFSSFILDKPVFIDYQLYNNTFYPVYLFSMFLLLVLILIPLFNGKFKEPVIFVSYISLSLLFILSAVNFNFIAFLLEYLSTNFFFGWIFRSPLKWQLYIPFFFSILLSKSFIGLIEDKSKRFNYLAFIIILGLIILPNFYISSEINKNLLTPKYPVYFEENLVNKIYGESILIVKNKPFTHFTNEDNSFISEMSFILNSGNIRYNYIDFTEDYKNIFDTNYKNYKYILFYNPILNENGYGLKLEKRFENGFVLYSLEDNISQVKIVNSLFVKKNPIKYKIYVEELNSLIDVYLISPRNPNWKLYLKKNPTSDWCKPIEFYNNTNTTECEHTQKFFEGEELSYLWKKPIFDDTHTMVYDYANQWTIDPQYIKDNYPPRYYTENPDGSINIELVMYFKPQSYFYLGLIISCTTLILCIGYLVYDLGKIKK